jgi:hypothetical protein
MSTFAALLEILRFADIECPVCAMAHRVNAGIGGAIGKAFGDRRAVRESQCQQSIENFPRLDFDVSQGQGQSG